jgi:splicing factor 3A subunit 3
MSGTLLEQTRADHEEVERLERLIVKDLQREVRTQKERLHQNHRVRNMLDSIMLTSARLVRRPRDLRVPCTSASFRCFSCPSARRIRLNNGCLLQVDIYEDKDRARQDEVALLGGQGAGGQNVFSVFYDRLKEVRKLCLEVELSWIACKSQAVDGELDFQCLTWSPCMLYIDNLSICCNDRIRAPSE